VAFNAHNNAGSEDGSSPGIAISICECDNERCDEVIEIDSSEYERIRERGRGFFVAQGHEDGQRVIESRELYSIVEAAESSEL
jgi:hypothetical protein